MPVIEIKRGYFNIDVYKVKVNIYICEDSKKVTEKVNAILKKAKDKDRISFNCKGYTMNTESNQNVYHLLFSVKDLDVNTITHETDHLRNFIINFNSIIEDNDAKEASANLNGYINEMVFKFLIKNNIPFKL